jgi:hypothetical protein
VKPGSKYIYSFRLHTPDAQKCAAGRELALQSLGLCGFGCVFEIAFNKALQVPISIIARSSTLHQTLMKQRSARVGAIREAQVGGSVPLFQDESERGYGFLSRGKMHYRCQTERSKAVCD